MKDNKKMHKVIPETYPSYSETKKIKVYPTFRLGTDDLPDLKEMEVGKKYTLVMEVEVMSKMQGDEWNQNSDKNKEIRSSLKVLKVGCDMPKKKATTSGKEFEMEYASKRSGGTGSRYDKSA